MIIQIRGTSGSGKTTAMRKVMTKLGPWQEIRIEGRRNPLWYDNSQGVALIGSYEATCGGVDTIHGYDQLQELVETLLVKGYHVLMEGLLLSEDTKQTFQMVAKAKSLGKETHVIFLNTSLDTCLQRVQGRRAAKGNDKPLNPLNTSKRVATINRARAKLTMEGIHCVSLHGDQVPGVVLKWLGK